MDEHNSVLATWSSHFCGWLCISFPLISLHHRTQRTIGAAFLPPLHPKCWGKNQLLGLGAGMGLVLFTVSTNAQLTNN